MPRRLVPAGLIAIVAALPAWGDAPAPAGVRVFVCGHSFHMPIREPLGQMARAAGITGHKLAGFQGIGGSTVSKHWDVPDPDNKVRNAIKARQVDVLTLAPNQLLPDPAIDKFTDLLLEYNPAGRVTVQASWIPRDGQRGAFANAQRDAADLAAVRKAQAPFTDKVRAQVEAINARYADKLKRPVVFMVPVGEAVVRLRERVAKGEVPGIARQSELFRDDLGHGKAPLYTLVAYCHFAVIYDRSPVGLAVPEFLANAGLGENAAKVNRVLQEVAWAAVTAEPASGVKSK
ncbi:MAG TPA: hypothetical protein VGF55_02190 [Gemmataceae bacterium]|jgi:hypothetical protein